MSNDTSVNLMYPADTPHENIVVLFFCAAVLRAVHRHQDLLRASVASAGNDHRLGASEAPPAIMSVFLGRQLSDVFDRLKAGSKGKSAKSGLLGLGVDTLPTLPRHAGDRNRTSPFAFTGNKFEFRAVGSSQSITFPNVVLNTIVAEALDEMGTMLEEKLGDSDGASREQAVADVISSVLTESDAIVFDGDGYAEAWHEEAARRGLLNLPNTLDAFEMLPQENNVALFSKYGVLSERELDRKSVG